MTIKKILHAFGWGIIVFLGVAVALYPLFPKNEDWGIAGPTAAYLFLAVPLGSIFGLITILVYLFFVRNK